MAQIALAVVGNALLPGVGGFIGGFVGGMIDKRLFGGGSQRLPDAVGPRLNSLKVQESQYGNFVPQIFGRMRVAGNVIWARDIKEVERRETTTTGGGGKGGGGGGGSSQTTITYEYFATLAIAICEGEIDEVVRVWADSKVISAEELAEAQGKYEVYYGSETQTASPIMESFEGAGQVPAYRGTAYVVIQDFPLADFGGRIPNFTFEVRRTVRQSGGLEDIIKDLVLIPASGEFVYSKNIVEKSDITVDALGNYVDTGKREKMNMHNFDGVANVNLALDQMADALPNLEWVAVVVNWFINTKVVANAECLPRVEFQSSSARTIGEEWSVAGITRAGAAVVQAFPDGSPTYGGTPSDASVLALCQDLKARGYNVMLYPMPLVDTVNETPGEDDKPWRGRLVPTSSSDVSTFFTRTNGYNRFIRHYAQLCASTIDAYVIGSELVGLTTYDSGGNTYPAVSQLKTLAGLVQSDLGGGPLVVYAADWTEYHSVNGYYHMDALWTDSNIDVVGIDSYFPLTPDLPQSEITPEKIKEYWEKGEGWDYYYSDPVNRTGKTNYSGATFAWKNLENWWNSAHYHNGNPGSPTGWTAKLKPIWFTEIGFPSVDGAANQPNVFVDPTSIESYYPRGSQQRVDFRAQREALQASLEFLQDREAEAGNTGLVSRAFVWTWDARPYSYWPDLLDVWADGNNWKTGHWINGKVGLSGLAAIVANICDQCGLSGAQYDVSDLVDQVEGYIIADRSDGRALIEALQQIYFFDMVESAGQLKFVKRGQSSVVTIDETSLIPFAEDDAIKDIVEIERQHDLELPKAVDCSYVNRPSGFNPGTQRAQRQIARSVGTITINAPVVLSDTEGLQIAEKTLYTAWVARTSYRFRLPPEFAYLEPTDVVTLTINGVDHILRLTETQLARAGMIEAGGVAEDISTYDFYQEPGETPPNPTQGNTIPATQLVLLDLPAFPTDSDDGVGSLRIGVTSPGANWKGAVIYRSDDGGEDGGNTFAVINSTQSEAVIGKTLNALPAGPTEVFDTGNYLDVALTGGALASTTQLSVLNGANSAVVGDEIIQFQTATLLSAGVYRLTNLLRGRLGTEHATGGHAVQDDFILLDSAILKQGIPVNFIGIEKYYKPVTVGATLADTDETAFTYNGQKFKPYSPVQITATRDGSDNIEIAWIRRTRIGGDWLPGVDVPLGEETEAYEIDVLDGSDVVRTLTATSATVTYTAADQTTDFGAPQSSVDIRVYQMSAVVGRGTPGAATV